MIKYLNEKMKCNPLACLGANLVIISLVIGPLYFVIADIKKEIGKTNAMIINHIAGKKIVLASSTFPSPLSIF